MKIFPSVSLLAAAISGLMIAVTPAHAASNSSKFTICASQTYALCALASCFVMDGIAYCQCDVMSGDSISLSDKYGDGNDVCSVNAQGAGNGYMVSTYSLPDAVIAPNGNEALYTCPASTSNGAYAQCDGGMCFTSTQGASFPGFDTPLGNSQIICSCPITTAEPAAAQTGYQIAGPYPCQKSFFKNCHRGATNKKTGSTIYVGAPTGAARNLTRLLNGSVPPINQCLP